jgi:hypothetical protein
MRRQEMVSYDNVNGKVKNVAKCRVNVAALQTEQPCSKAAILAFIFLSFFIQSTTGIKQLVRLPGRSLRRAMSRQQQSREQPFRMALLKAGRKGSHRSSRA